MGARPQFIKAAPVSKALREAGHLEYLVHTGQHYDDDMSAVFFREMNIAEPDANLGIGSGSHGWQTSQMLIGLERLITAENPEAVLVYGDTNSTLAGALAACKLGVPVAHVEAGLRSFNRAMPEEHNRVLTDHCADLLFCPTEAAVENLAREGITDGVHLTGDTMYDAVLQFAEVARRRSTILRRLDLEPCGYLLATVHRPYNTDVTENLRGVLRAFLGLNEQVIFPAHPRTRRKIAEIDGFDDLGETNLTLIEPVGYFDMLVLEENAKMILTDSGGIQKEAYFFGVPCVTLRPETEWVETIDAGWNALAGCGGARLREAMDAVASEKLSQLSRRSLFGNGRSAEEIVSVIEKIASRTMFRRCDHKAGATFTRNPAGSLSSIADPPTS